MVDIARRLALEATEAMSPTRADRRGKEPVRMFGHQFCDKGTAHGIPDQVSARKAEMVEQANDVSRQLSGIGSSGGPITLAVPTEVERDDPMILRHVRDEADVDKRLQSTSAAVHEHDRGAGANVDVPYADAIRVEVSVCTRLGRRCTRKGDDGRRDGPTSDVRGTSLHGNGLSDVREHMLSG
jgi:hypothetical protein